jgi:hypothetical protein
MKLKPYGNIVKCNYCNEYLDVYIPVYRCPWCSYYNFIRLNKTPGRYIYPTSLIWDKTDYEEFYGCVVKKVIKLPYIPSPEENIRRTIDPKDDFTWREISEGGFQKKKLQPADGRET